MGNHRNVTDFETLSISPVPVKPRFVGDENTEKEVGLRSGQIDGPELLHEAERVVLHPPFGDLPVLELSKYRAPYLDLIARRFDTHEFTLVSSSMGGPHRDGIAFGDEVVDRYYEVRKGGE
jgi:hypothetical protein